MRGRLIGAFGLTLITVTSAWAADVSGSKDPPGLKRFEGSEIIHYETRSYDQYIVSTKGRFDETQKLEGGIIRVIYRIPQEGEHTSLELARNYEDMLTDAGFSKKFELAPDDFGHQIDEEYFFKNFWQKSSGAPFGGGMNTAHDVYYTVYKGSKEGKDVTVVVLAVASQGMNWEEAKVKDPIPVKAGQILVAVDVVTGKARGNKMVEVKAADMAQALATKGQVEIYGIYFDVDKTDLKPESTKTLDEIARLLKSDGSLRLEVAGHTDNTGAPEHNLQLSEGRAAAVVTALVTTYGIDKARLEAKGYGDTRPIATNDTDEGRAKNRRVELKKI